MAQSFRRKPQARSRIWCCTFALPPISPKNPSMHHSEAHPSKSHPLSKPTFSVSNSPQSAQSGLGIVGRIDPRRILSPGRVSPIDSYSNLDSIEDIGADRSAAVDSPEFRSQSILDPTEKFRPLPESSGSGCRMKDSFDVRLNLKGKNGGCMVLELNPGVLSANSEVFAGLIADYKKGLSSSASPGPKMCRIEVPEVQNLGVFKETVELMFEDDITIRLTKDWRLSIH